MSTAQGGAREAGSPEDAQPGHTPHGGIDQLVRMANDIGNFFRAEPDHRVAVAGVSNHINKFWSRRMRQKILVHFSEGGAGLEALPREALTQVVVTPTNSGDGA